MVVAIYSGCMYVKQSKPTAPASVYRVGILIGEEEKASLSWLTDRLSIWLQTPAVENSEILEVFVSLNQSSHQQHDGQLINSCCRLFSIQKS